METILIYFVFLSILVITLKKTAISLAILLNINLFRAIPYVNYKHPFYGYYNENDILLGAILPILCFIIIILKIFWKKKKIKYHLDVFDVFMVLLGAIMVVSILVSPNKSTSILYTGIFLILGCPFYFVTKLFFFNSKNQKKDFLLFLGSLVFFGIIFSIISLYLHSIAKYPYERMTFPGVYPIPFCLFLCMSLIILILYQIKPNFKTALSKRKKILFSLPILCVIAFSIIKTNTRGPVFATILSFVFLLLMFFRIKLNTKIIMGFIFSFFMGLVVFVTAFDFNKIAVRFINLVPKDADSLSPRILAYLDSIHLLFVRPWGISVGTFGEFYYANSNNESGTYAHNVFMELISSFGVIGLLLSFLIIYVCLHEYNFIIKNQKKIFSDNFLFITICLFLFFFFEAQFSFTLNTHKGWYLTMALYSVFKFKLLKNKYNEG
ncbi:O-antigen ligase family protein [Polaribacter haliotis]|uniref:O-antigen ligase family protein n=1 Tax=Polaribacter haliotis TaxID=1888915 RepID=A0A7L8ACE9_9FLAO|nr:O-antigen ligase family protein [Polaribacter haliotis]QOD59676.1 O-antigen ligase family protein [Polaribacter haliotis]